MGTHQKPAPTARFIEIRARISAGGISGGNEARRLAIRATRFIPDDALAEELANRLADELDYVALIAAMNDETPGPSEGALLPANRPSTLHHRPAMPTALAPRTSLY